MGYRNYSISQRYVQICPNGCRAQLDGENPVDLVVGLLQRLLQQSNLSYFWEYTFLLTTRWRFCSFFAFGLACLICSSLFFLLLGN